MSFKHDSLLFLPLTRTSYRQNEFMWRKRNKLNTIIFFLWFRSVCVTYSTHTGSRIMYFITTLTNLSCVFLLWFVQIWWMRLFAKVRELHACITYSVRSVCAVCVLASSHYPYPTSTDTRLSVVIWSVCSNYWTLKSVICNGMWSNNWKLFKTCKRFPIASKFYNWKEETELHARRVGIMQILREIWLKRPAELTPRVQRACSVRVAHMRRTRQICTHPYVVNSFD